MIGWRKWSVAMASLAMAFVLAMLGKLTGEFATIVSVANVAFHAANASTAHSRANA